MARDYNFCVYIMTNKHHTVFYIGMTDDLARRISEHCTDVLAAITREKQLKRWSRSKKVALIATMNPHWRDLAPEVLEEEQQPASIGGSPA